MYHKTLKNNKRCCPIQHTPGASHTLLPLQFTPTAGPAAVHGLPAGGCQSISSARRRGGSGQHSVLPGAHTNVQIINDTRRQCKELLPSRSTSAGANWISSKNAQNQQARGGAVLRPIQVAPHTRMGDHAMCQRNVAGGQHRGRRCGQYVNQTQTATWSNGHTIAPAARDG